MCNNLRWVPIKFVQIVQFHRVLNFWRIFLELFRAPHVFSIGEFPHCFTMVKHIFDFFSETAGRNSFILHMQQPYMGPYQVCPNCADSALFGFLPNFLRIFEAVPCKVNGSNLPCKVNGTHFQLLLRNRCTDIIHIWCATTLGGCLPSLFK